MIVDADHCKYPCKLFNEIPKSNYTPANLIILRTTDTPIMAEVNINTMASVSKANTTMRVPAFMESNTECTFGWIAGYLNASRNCGIFGIINNIIGDYNGSIAKTFTSYTQAGALIIFTDRVDLTIEMCKGIFTGYEDIQIIQHEDIELYTDNEIPLNFPSNNMFDIPVRSNIFSSDTVRLNFSD